MKENVNSLTWTRVCCENEMWREWERTWTRVVLWEPQREEAWGRRGHEFSDVNQSRSVRTITRCGVGKNLGIRFKLHDMVEENVIALTWNGMRRENWKTLGITCCHVPFLKWSSNPHWWLILFVFMFTHKIMFSHESFYIYIYIFFTFTSVTHFYSLSFCIL